MPHAPLRPCTYPGCNVLVSSGRCVKHAPKNTYIAPETKKLYGGRQWQSIRARQLSEFTWCAECLKEGRYTPATEVDHIEPHRGDATKFFDGALQSLCKPCHSAKTAKEVLHS